MVIYRLWRQTDNHTFRDIEARDNEHAIAVFGEMLGTFLTLKQGQAAPEYMMGSVDKEAGWARPPDIPVWTAS